MKIRGNKIVEITEDELYTLYLKRGIDDVMSFPDYKEAFKKAGCEVIEQ